MTEFEKYAQMHCGISSLRLHDYKAIHSAYINPMILEERQLNVTQLDVFSRLMMDRILIVLHHLLYVLFYFQKQHKLNNKSVNK